ncbi:MAG: thioredoxin family protein [Chitinispirillales bacterium]|jgi:thiol:disulfide interchange protein|nr:thioredoxin family protein [Chitinispirillales bacterium]
MSNFHPFLIRFFAVLLFSALTVLARDLELKVQPGKAWYRPGDTVVVGIQVSIPPRFHLYANPLGPGIGKPLLFTISQNENVEWIEVRKSAPKRYNPPIGDWVWAYESRAFFFLKGVLDKNFSGCVVKCEVGVKAEAGIEALICHNSCIPVEIQTAFHLSVDTTAKRSDLAFPDVSSWQARYDKSQPMEFKISNASSDQTSPPSAGLLGEVPLNLNLDGFALPAQKDSSEKSFTDKQNSYLTSSSEEFCWAYSPLEERKEYNLLTAIFVALIAGLALNITPCVFPLLGIRALGFVQGVGESRRRAVIRSLFFAAGIVGVFVLLAGFAAFAGFSWGQQFQNPYVMVGIIAMVFLFSLGMFDFYTFMVPAGAGGIGKGMAKRGLVGDFLKGAGAAVLATPCGGPFLGALLAWALLQEPLTVFILFAVMGVGMALPYVLLSSSRRLLGMLPKPGRWMEDFKHIMGFLLLIFSVYLMKSLDLRFIVMTVGICLSILCAASLNKRFAPFGSSAPRRLFVISLSGVLLLTGSVFSALFLPVNLPSTNYSTQSSYTDSLMWTEFSPQALKAAHAGGRSAVVNFTASWCTNCHINKAAVLDAPAARELYGDKKVALFTADITNSNPQAQSLLHHLGSRSVPFLAVFPADSPERPVVMHGLLSKDKYFSVLKKLP